MDTWNPNIRWLVLSGVLIFSGGLIFAATRHAVAEHWAGTSNPGLWLRAADLEPTNPDNWYHLGRYRQLDFEHGDLPLAISYYRRATTIEPISAQYWMELAGAYETSGDLGMAEQAYHTAQQDYPISAEVAWRYGNFLLRQNRIEEGFRQIRNAVSVDPKLAPLAVSRCWISTKDIDRILKFALPSNSEVYGGAIQFFISIRDMNAAMAVWNRLATQGASFPLSQSSALLDLLIGSGRVRDALMVWQQSLTAAGIAPLTSGDSLIWDGGFEQELLNEGFAWRYQPIQGAELNWDEQTVHSGHRSLRVTFDGSANLDFQQIWQYVAVQPNTAYRFGAYIRTDELSSDSGIHFEIQGVAHPITPLPATPNVVGTQPWALDDIEFTTGPQTQVLKVLLRRPQSNFLGSKIRGTVWVDDVSLVPAAQSSLGVR